TSITTLTDDAWVVDLITNSDTGAYSTTTHTERGDANGDSQRTALGTRSVSVAGQVTNTWTHSAVGTRTAHVLAAFAAHSETSVCAPVGADGCSDSCGIDPGWICPVAGESCMAEACGDDIVAGTEECESARTTPASACTASCTFAVGYSCTESGAGIECFTPPEVCNNDGVVDFGERCDDGNVNSGDGCSPLCEIEPGCRPNGGGATAACTSACGDGFLLPGELALNPDACDDGNNVDGDGCSATCEVEQGWECQISSVTPTTVNVPV